MAGDSARWLKALSDALEALEREHIGSRCPVVDHQIVTPAGGGIDDLLVWLICRTDEEKRQFQDTEHGRFAAGLRRRLIAAGWPDSAITSLSTRVTSRSEVQARGGRLGIGH